MTADGKVVIEMLLERDSSIRGYKKKARIT